MSSQNKDLLMRIGDAFKRMYPHNDGNWASWRDKEAHQTFSTFNYEMAQLIKPFLN